MENKWKQERTIFHAQKFIYYVHYRQGYDLAHDCMLLVSMKVYEKAAMCTCRPEWLQAMNIFLHHPMRSRNVTSIDSKTNRPLIWRHRPLMWSNGSAGTLSLSLSLSLSRCLSVLHIHTHKLTACGVTYSIDYSTLWWLQHGAGWLRCATEAKICHREYAHFADWGTGP